MKYGLVILLLHKSSSHPTRGAWIEMSSLRLGVTLGWSHPTRGAWIEIFWSGRRRTWSMVAPHTGCVD